MASAASMIRTAAKYGATYRRQEMLDDIRKFQGHLKYQAGIEKLSGDSLVPKAWMVEVELKEPGAKYRVFGKGTFYDWNTGAEYEKTVSFYHTSWMEKDDYAEAFDSFFFVVQFLRGE